MIGTGLLRSQFGLEFLLLLHHSIVMSLGCFFQGLNNLQMFHIPALFSPLYATTPCGTPHSTIS
eukprot:12378753-Prorocentrum_lima.AAC.1